MKYNVNVVNKYFEQCGLMVPMSEYRFHPVRRWRFDFAWVDNKVFLEVQGGLFTGGRHTRGAALLKEYEKLNNATMLGWRGIFVTPQQLCTNDTIEIIKTALAVDPTR